MKTYLAINIKNNKKKKNLNNFEHNLLFMINKIVKFKLKLINVYYVCCYGWFDEYGAECEEASSLDGLYTFARVAPEDDTPPFSNM